MFIFQKDEFQPRNICNIAVAVIGAAGVGAAATAFGASKAADAQKHAADQAAAISREQYQQTRADLAPYRDIGLKYGKELDTRMPFLTSPIEMDQATLEKTPGYQFTRKQGLKAVQNSAAARGLGVSGAALKGAAGWATDLANTTYKDQFNLENINRTNAYNRLKGMVDTGQNASAQTGTFGAQAAKDQAGYAIGAGNADAAMWNAIGGSLAKGGSDIGGYFAYKGIFGR